MQDMQRDIQQEQEIQQSTAVDEPIGTEESTQRDLFEVSDASTDGAESAERSAVHINLLTEQSSLAECVVPYQKELMLRGKSNYTVTCFLSDLKMFSEHTGYGTPVGRITKEQLTDWLMKLKFGTRGQVPAPKTMARRVTFLKNFFAWLHGEAVIKEDPASSLTLERPLPPLPELLHADEIQGLLTASAEDPRCQSLVYLALHAGLKKEEVMGLKVQQVDLSDERVPLITVRFAASTNKQHRERRLALPSEFTQIFKEYQQKYHITNEVFACTDRNLNYILAKAVKSANIKKRVTLQLLRDTFAVQQLKSGVTPEALREKMGLSDEAWLESREKYRRLALPK